MAFASFATSIRCHRSIGYHHFILLLLLAVATVILPVAVAMRVVVQRVTSASVTVQDECVSKIGPGIMVLVGLHENDTREDLEYCARKLVGCKLWENDDDKPWRKSVKQMQYECLLVSQFTLYGTVTNKKHQPDYKYSMKSEPARNMYDEFKSIVATMYGSEEKIHDGVFGAMMDVTLVNDGPVTLVIDSPLKTESSNAVTNS